MNTSFTPATAVVKVRLFGSSPSGPVATLKRGSLIATYAFFPRGFNSRTHSPILAGVPDGWSFGNTEKLVEFDSRLVSVNGDVTEGPTSQTAANPKFGLEENSIRMQKSFVVMVLAEEITVRRVHANATWVDAHVSVLLRGESCIHARWVDSEGTNSDVPQKMFQAGEEFSVMLQVDPVSGRQDMLLCASVRASTQRGCRKTYKQIVKPVGEFVHPPVKISMTRAETIGGVFIDALTSKQLRAEAGFGERVSRFTIKFEEIYAKRGLDLPRDYDFNTADADNAYDAVVIAMRQIFTSFGLDTGGLELFNGTLPGDAAGKTGNKNNANDAFVARLSLFSNDCTTFDVPEYLEPVRISRSFVQSAIEDGHGLIIKSSA